MRTTINIDDKILEKARQLSKIEEKTALIHEALKILIEKYSRERLIALGGTEKAIKPIPRRR